MNLKVNVTIVSAVLFVVLGYAHEHGSNCSHGHSHAETKMSRPGPFLENIHDVHDRDHDHKNAKCTANHQTVHPVKSVAVVKAVQQAMGLKTVRVERRRIDSTMTFAGRYELVPDARKVVSSPVAGRLSFIARTLDNVRKGDPLFTVTSPDLVARSREISLLEKRLKVYRELNTPNAALENELAVKCAEREAMLAGADENDGVVTVRAAEDGMVESLIARDGAWLDTGAEALQTVHVRHLRFKALAAVSDALQLKDGLSAKVGTNAGCIRVGVGDDTGIVPVYVLFDDYVNALAGERSYAECVTDGAETAHLAVPARCIVSMGLQPTVFIRDAHDRERFIAVSVVPRATSGGWTAVEGLPAHDCEVVSDGAYELKLALPATGEAKPSGHFHADGVFHEGEH